MEIWIIKQQFPKQQALRKATTMCPRPQQVATWRATQIFVWWPWSLNFDLGTGVQCNPWHGQPSCQFWCFRDFSLSSYGQTRIKLTWRYNLDIWPLKSPRMSVMQVMVLHPYTQFEVWSLPIKNIWLSFSHGVKWPSDLDLWNHRNVIDAHDVGLPVLKIWLIFNHGLKRPGDLDLWPLNGGHGSAVLWAPLLPILSFYALPFSI